MEILPIELSGQAIADAIESHLECGRKEYRGPGCALCHRSGEHSDACRAPRLLRALRHWRDAVLLAADACDPVEVQIARAALLAAGSTLAAAACSVHRSSVILADKVVRCRMCAGVVNRTSFGRPPQHEEACHLMALVRALDAWRQLVPSPELIDDAPLTAVAA